jgi:predicted transposase YdaD
VRTSGERSDTPGSDRAYKRLFSHPLIIEELLRGFVGEDWTERLDFSTLEPVHNSFVSSDLRERHSDLIWRLRLTGEEGGWVYVYLLLEFQSTSDPFMAVRFLTYVGLLLEKIIRDEKLRPGDRLPAVFPLVFHNGKGRWLGPLHLESLFVPVPEELKRYLPRLTYCLIDERRLDLSRADLARNPTAALFRIETSPTPEDLPRLTRAFDDLVPPEDSELRRSFKAWLSAIARRAFPDAIIPEGVDLTEAPMLEETLIEWRKKVERQAKREGLRKGRQEGHREGRREGRQEGQIQGMQKLLLRQMALRFGRLPREARSHVEQINSLRELDKLAQRVLAVSSLAEMGLNLGQRQPHPREPPK